MEDRIQINGVWYKREEPKREPAEWPVEEMVCSCRTYIFETTEFCFQASRSYKDNSDTLYSDMDIEFTDKRVKPWKEEYWDNPNWFRGILDNNPDSLKEALKELGGNGVEQLQAFLGYLKDKGWL